MNKDNFGILPKREQAMIKRYHFGPNGKYECIVGKREGKPFFVVPTQYSLQFETYVASLLRNKGAKLKQIRVSFPSGKNNFYEIEKLQSKSMLL